MSSPSSSAKKYQSWLFLGLTAAVVLGGALLFRERFYAWIALLVAVLSCLPLLISFEKRHISSGELMLLAAFVALTVVSRMIFAWLPGIKPVTALIIIAALSLGGEAGFVIGSLSAVLSNLYFGQGPWTPFQMLVWGLIGLLAGWMAKRLLRSRWALGLFGVGSALLFSAVMDVWSVLWTSGGLSLDRYLAATVAALPTTALYAASNLLFLLIFTRPLTGMLGRICTKYALFQTNKFR